MTTYTTREVAERLGITRQAVDGRRKRRGNRYGRLVTDRTGATYWVYNEGDIIALSSSQDALVPANAPLADQPAPGARRESE